MTTPACTSLGESCAASAQYSSTSSPWRWASPPWRPFAYQWLPQGGTAIAVAVFIILMLPRQPRFVAAFCAGAAFAVAFALVVFMIPGWDNCADEVGGELVEYKCSEGPPRR